MTNISREAKVVITHGDIFADLYIETSRVLVMCWQLAFDARIDSQNIDVYVHFVGQRQCKDLKTLGKALFQTCPYLPADRNNAIFFKNQVMVITRDTYHVDRQRLTASRDSCDQSTSP